MIQHIDHIGIAVHNIEDARGLYEEMLGFEFAGIDVVEEQGVRVAFFKASQVMIELLEPTRDSSPIAKFLDRKGPGIHHIAFATDDIEHARDTAQKSSIRLLSDKPLDGAHGKLITFMHPKDTLGVLMEFTQRKKSASPTLD